MEGGVPVRGGASTAQGPGHETMAGTGTGTGTGPECSRRRGTCCPSPWSIILCLACGVPLDSPSPAFGSRHRRVPVLPWRLLSSYPGRGLPAGCLELTPCGQRPRASLQVVPPLARVERSGGRLREPPAEEGSGGQADSTEAYAHHKRVIGPRVAQGPLRGVTRCSVPGSWGPLRARLVRSPLASPRLLLLSAPSAEPHGVALRLRDVMSETRPPSAESD